MIAFIVSQAYSINAYEKLQKAEVTAMRHKIYSRPTSKL